MSKTREEALALLNEYTKTPGLVKHALAVEAAMQWYAEFFNQPPEEVKKWRITGLLHDFDYEQHPHAEKPDGHPFWGERLLGELGYDQDIRDAILGHAQYSGVPRNGSMSKTLFAVDELAGFITACALVRPDKSLKTLEASSVLKRMKDKAFARSCNRDDIRQGAEELGVDLPQHIANVIASLRKIADELGL